MPSSPGYCEARLEPDALPVALVDEAPVAVAVAAQPLLHGRVAQPLLRLLPAVGEHPLRQDPGHLAEPVAERRRVGEHVEALDLARLLHRVDRALPRARRGAGAVAHVEVRDLALRAALADDLEELLDRVLQVRVAVADVARVVAAVAADHLVETDDLLGRRGAARVELEPGRDAERAGVHRLGDVALHRDELLLGRPRREHAGGVAHPVVADEPREVLRVAGVREEREVLGEALPLDRARRRRTSAAAPR